jgi:regulator of extracellular matrix RemA (YlzA/DUF370 family)
MLGWLDVGKGGILSVSRIVAVSRIDSAPIQRLVNAFAADRVIDLTYGRPRRSLIVLDSGHIAIVSMAPQMVFSRLQEDPHAASET